MFDALSDISRTNQLEILQANNDEIAEKIYRFLSSIGKGIECFSVKNFDLSKYDGTSFDFYHKRHLSIKQEIKKRFLDLGKKCNLSDVQYFLSNFKGKNYVFFIIPDKGGSAWKKLFCEDINNRKKIINLVFKIYLLSFGLPTESIGGFEKLLLIDSMSIPKSEKELFVWGQNVSLNYNSFNVLTLSLSRKRMIFSPENKYITIDGDEMGEILIHKKKNYYYLKTLKGRSKNYIQFMRFDANDEDLQKFKKTQLYHYQNLMTKLENFLDICGIDYKRLNFETQHYFENNFIDNIESVDSLEIINNAGNDLSEKDKLFLTIFFTNQGISTISFYNFGKTISSYEQLESEEGVSWKITETISWDSISLDSKKNYLVFNKTLDEDTGISMAYQDKGICYPNNDKHYKENVDFYSQLKRKTNYMESRKFFSLQGVNVRNFVWVKDDKTEDFSILTYKKINTFRAQNQDFCDHITKNIQDIIMENVLEGNLYNLSDKFKDTYHYILNISPQMQKILIELGIKSWIKKSFSNSEAPLPIKPQEISEKKFFVIYVRSPKKQKAQVVAVEFLYKECSLHIKNLLFNLQEIENRFPFLKRQKMNSDKLINNQQYYIDEEQEVYISCYTHDDYTPTLIGHETIMERLEKGTLEINRINSNRLLPHVLYYNEDLRGSAKMKNLICLDLSNKSFAQYYVPPAQPLKRTIPNGFRVYHMIGTTFKGERLSIQDLIQNPVALLHFHTLTQNVLKIRNNSQSSILQKVAKVFIEN